MIQDEIEVKKLKAIKEILDKYEIPHSDYLSNELYNSIVKPLVSTLSTIKQDAEMAMSGEWDCTTEEGIETGFGGQIALIDQVL